jgi:hypothetical protein
MLKRRFQSQVRDQCKFLIFSAQGLDDAMTLLQQHGPMGPGMDLLWYQLQNLLTAAANISKVLWGAGGKLDEERRPVRESLGVPDDSPLQNTDLRNHFEHFDERLDRWWIESGPNHHFFDRNLGPPGMIGALTPMDQFRQYDLSTHKAVFWGVEHDIKAIFEAAAELLPVAEAEANKPHWEE